MAVELVSNPACSAPSMSLNVLARLNASPVPASVETSLQLKEAPLADTGRYDSLRAGGRADAVEVDHA